MARSVWDGAVFELLVGILVGFTAGYGVREIVSQRRRAAARKHFLLKQSEETDLSTSRQIHIDRLKHRGPSSASSRQN
jgi:hypothetical protein